MSHLWGGISTKGYACVGLPAAVSSPNKKKYQGSQKFSPSVRRVTRLTSPRVKGVNTSKKYQFRLRYLCGPRGICSSKSMCSPCTRLAICTKILREVGCLEVINRVLSFVERSLSRFAFRLNSRCNLVFLRERDQNGGAWQTAQLPFALSLALPGGCLFKL